MIVLIILMIRMIAIGTEQKSKNLTHVEMIVYGKVTRSSRSNNQDMDI